MAASLSAALGFSVTSVIAANAATAQVTTAQVTPKTVVEHYTNIAQATYQDALTQAKKLKVAIEVFISTPNDQNLQAAKAAWLTARVPYQQSEVFRFGNKLVDDWEGQLNAWPLDEGFIDYVDTKDYQHELGNEVANLNLIAANKPIKVGSTSVDVSNITPELLASLNELGGSEANVATGYHAIEFLLWGQDLNGTGPGAGNRPTTDYASGKDCTNQHCERRKAYLQAAADLLVSDLEWMTNQWAPGIKDNYRAQLLQAAPSMGLRKMLYGMGSLALGELAGERIKVALEANSTEDEHDCFSDNTHNSHFYNAKGIENIYYGRYLSVDGYQLEGPSLYSLVYKQNAKKAKALSKPFNQTQQAFELMVATAESGMTFDQMIAPNNKKGHKIANQAIDALVEETQAIKEIASLVGVKQLKPDTADHSF